MKEKNNVLLFIYYVLYSISIMNLKLCDVYNIFLKLEWKKKIIKENVVYWLMLFKFLSKKSVVIGIKGFVIFWTFVFSRYRISCMAAILFGKCGFLSFMFNCFISFLMVELFCKWR